MDNKKSKLSPLLSYILFVLIVLLLWYFNGSGHSDEIKSDMVFRAERMGMQVNYMSVKFMGNGEYKCIYDVYDPGSLFSSPNKIHKVTIEKWENGSHEFVRNE